MGYEAVVRTIPHHLQRYDTVGDYWTDDNGVLQLRVSELGDWRYEFLVVFHELAEKAITRHLGVLESDIDKFDIEYEKGRQAGNYDEPGDDCRSPYHEAHVVATYLERELSVYLGVDWQMYDKKVKEL